MKLYRPTKSNLIAQSFGLNGTAASMIPTYQSLGLKAHDGFDFSVSCKDWSLKHGGQCEQVYCNVTGTGSLTITHISKDDDRGWGVIAIDERWNKFLWWHFDIINPVLYIGAKIKFGDLLGTSGNTGLSTGAHVHFAYYPYGEDYNNGYHGAADPEPYYDSRFCLDVKIQIDLITKLIEFYKSLISLIK